jgi:hypothetical protein
MMKKWLLLALLCLGLHTAAIAATELKVGDTLPTISLKDQHDKAVTVATDAQTLIFTVEKPASDLVNDYLKTQAADYLIAQKAYFLADISGMPSMITKMFAIPKMQERPYAILLGYEADALAFMPRQQNHVTVVKVKANKVEQILFVNDEASLRNHL